MGAIVTNNAVSTLSAGITSGATSLSITSGDEGKFPSPATGEWFPVTLVDTSGNLEIAHCTARSGTTLTVKRGQEGTTAKAFLAGTRIDVRPTAEVISTALALSKNVLINGNFDIWQRGTSQTSNGYGSDDRWINSHSGSTKTHSQQAFTPGQTDVPGNPKYFSRTVVSSVAGSGNYALKLQRIEGVETFSGETATLSFYAKADAAKNVAIELEQYFGTGGTPSSGVTGIGAQQVALTTAWQKFTLNFSVPSISGKSLGTDGNDFLGVKFWFDAGSSFDANTASLGQQSGTFDIAQVQLEKGSTATEFERRPIGLELSLCQRYFQRYASASANDAFFDLVNTAAIYQAHTHYLATQMRATPTVSTSALSTFQVLSNSTTSALSAMAWAGDAKRLYLSLTSSSSLTGGYSSILRDAGSNNSYIEISAEL